MLGELKVGVGDEFPMHSVNYSEALEFCKKATERGREAGDVPRGWSFQLPTEAQWEYACRAGTKTAFSFGKTLREREANFGKPDGCEVAVASYRPNAWGLHDMHGNVNEFCSNSLSDKARGGVDPQGPSGGEFIMFRGGSWFNDVGRARSAARGLFLPSQKGPNVGFRVACNVE